MPNNFVKSLSKKTDQDIATIEKLWMQAKQIVLQNTKENDAAFYPQVFAITKRLLQNKSKKESKMHIRYGDIPKSKITNVHNPDPIARAAKRKNKLKPRKVLTKKAENLFDEERN